MYDYFYDVSYACTPNIVEIRSAVSWLRIDWNLIIPNTVDIGFSQLQVRYCSHTQLG